MHCRWLKERETDYLDGTLDTNDRRAFSAHLSSCAECLTRIQELEELKKTLARLKDPAVPDALHSRIEKRLAEEKSQRAAGGILTFLLRPGFAASALTSALLICTIVLSPGYSKQLDIAPFILATLMQPASVEEAGLPPHNTPKGLLPFYNERGGNKIVHFTESKFAEVGQDSFAVLACTDPSGNSSFQGVIDGTRRLFRSNDSFPMYRTPRCVPASEIPPEDFQNVILYVFQRITVNE
jgi:hypothetical protein